MGLILHNIKRGFQSHNKHTASRRGLRCSGMLCSVDWHRDCPETPVTTYQSTLRNISEERRPHLHRDESLKSHTPCPLQKTTKFLLFRKIIVLYPEKDTAGVNIFGVRNAVYY